MKNIFEEFRKYSAATSYSSLLYSRRWFAGFAKSLFRKGEIESIYKGIGTDANTEHKKE